MQYLLGSVFLLVSIWQLFMTKGYYQDLKKNGNKNTSPFAMLSLFFSLAFSIILFVIGVRCFLGR